MRIDQYNHAYFYSFKEIFKDHFKMVWGDGIIRTVNPILTQEDFNLIKQKIASSRKIENIENVQIIAFNKL